MLVPVDKETGEKKAKLTPAEKKDQDARLKREQDTKKARGK